MSNPIPGPDDITRHVLDNGIVVLVRENFDAQSVVISGELAAGTIFEDPAKPGLASLTANTLLRGTATHDFGTLHETLESSGMSLGVDAGRHTVGFAGQALAEDLPTLLTLAADMLRNPTFPPNHVELVKGEIITGLTYNQQDTRYMAGRTFQELAYPPEHIYHRSTSGTIESINKLTSADLQAYHARQFGPGKMTIVVVGAVDPPAVLDVVNRIFGDWHNPTQQTTYAYPDLPTLDQIQLETVVLEGKTQSDLVLGIPGPSRTASDFQAARVANNILGVFGMMGRIGASIREEKGLAYYAASRLEGGMGPGAWKVYAGVNPKNVALAVESIREEVRRILQEPVSAADLADNQSNLINRLPLMLESNRGVAGNLLTMERYNLGLDYLRRYGDIIAALTVADIQAAVQQYWREDAFYLAVAGPQLEGVIL